MLWPIDREQQRGEGEKKRKEKKERKSATKRFVFAVSFRLQFLFTHIVVSSFQILGKSVHCELQHKIDKLSFKRVSFGTAFRCGWTQQMTLFRPKTIDNRDICGRHVFSLRTKPLLNLWNIKSEVEFRCSSVTSFTLANLSQRRNAVHVVTTNSFWRKRFVVFHSRANVFISQTITFQHTGDAIRNKS